MRSVLQSWLGERDEGGSAPSLPPRDEVLSTDVYFDTARHFLDVQLSTSDTLDGKTTQYLSAGSLALTITLALLNLDTRDGADISLLTKSLLGVALAGFSATLACAYQASRQRGLEYRPNIATLRANSQVYAGIVLKQWVADEYETSIRANAVVLGKKARWVGLELSSVVIETIGLVLAVAAAFLL